MNLRYNFLFILVFIFCYAGTASAQSPVYLASTSTPLKAENKVNDAGINISTDLTKAQQLRQLMAYLKGMENADVNYNPAKVKRLYNLANLFTRLRLYPLAMKCFFKPCSLILTVLVQEISR